MSVDYHVVLGCPRSGTTFLMRVFNTLPQTACVSGVIYPIDVPHILGDDAVSADVRCALTIGLERSLDRYLRSGLFNARATALQKWAAARTGVGGLVSALKGRQDVRRMIYKEPFFSFAPFLPYEALPEARLIYIHRDGRDCADSLIRTYDVLSDARLTDLRSPEMRLGRKVDHRYVPWWVDEGDEQAFLRCTPYARAVWMWKAMVARCRAYFTRPDVAASGRVLWLRYEDLVRDPIVYGVRAAAHLDLPVTKRFKRRLSEAHARSVGIHRRRDPREVDEATNVARAELAAYGYLD